MKANRAVFSGQCNPSYRLIALFHASTKYNLIKKNEEMWPSGNDFEKQKRKDGGVIPYVVSLLFLQVS